MNKIILFFIIQISIFIFANPIIAEEYRLLKIIDGLYKPWGLTFIDNENVLITLKSGEIVKVNIPDRDYQKITHNLEIKEYGQGGLLDILFKDNMVYVSYSEKRGDEKFSTSIALGKLSDNNIVFDNIFQSEPPVKENIHFGSRLAIKDNYLYASIGERRQGIATQDPSNHFGKIIRIKLDGTIPLDNPNFNNPQSLPEVFQIGLRNPLGMALSPIDNEVYITNHGPKGGDFFGKVIRAGNYGWDDVAWGGIDYDGSIIGDGSAWKPGYDKPIYRWIPSIAVSNIVFYKGDAFKDWEGDVLLASLKAQKLIKLEFKNGKVLNEVTLFDRKGRLRDVEINNKGEIFVIIDDANGSFWQLKKI